MGLTSPSNRAAPSISPSACSHKPGCPGMSLVSSEIFRIGEIVRLSRECFSENISNKYFERDLGEAGLEAPVDTPKR